MDLTPRDRRVEHAERAHLGPRPQLVALMPVEQVQREADLLLSSDWPAPEICRGLANSGAFPPESGLCLCAPATCNDPGWYLKRQEGLQNRRHVDEKACFIVLLNVPHLTPLRQPKLRRP